MVRRWWSASWRSVQGRPLLGLFGLYLLFRLPFLERLPIFNDEAIYLDWAWRQLHEPGNLFYGLRHDGKPPLLLWLFGLAELIVPNPLLAGRFVSVGAGSLTLWGVYRLGKELGNRSVAWASGLVYLAVPLLAFYERQALMESALGAIGVWALYLFYRWRRSGNRSWARWLGMVLGAGMWLKTTGLVFVIGGVGLVVWWWLQAKKRRRKIQQGLGELGLIGSVVTAPLWLQASFWLGLEKNSRYVLTVAELLSFPIQQWGSNLWALGEISFWQLTPGVLLLTLIGLIRVLKDQTTAKHWLIGWWVFQLLTFVLVSRQPSPRYLVSFLPLAAVLAGYGLVQLTKRNLGGQVMMGVILISALGVMFLQISRPLKYFEILEQVSDFSQKEAYVTGWSAGYGIPETWQYLEERARARPVLVGVRLDSGNPESAILAFAYRKSQLRAGYLDAQVLPDLTGIDCLQARVPVYYVSRDYHLGGLDQYLEEEQRFFKPGGQHSIGVYSLKQNCQGRALQL